MEESEPAGFLIARISHNIFIDGLCKQRRLGEAICCFQELRARKELRPCTVTFNSLISGLCNTGYVDVAKLFVGMMLKYGLVPDRFSYASLVHGLSIAGRMEEALEFCEDMERVGIEPDVVTYNILINGFRILGLMNWVWR